LIFFENPDGGIPVLLHPLPIVPVEGFPLEHSFARCNLLWPNLNLTRAYQTNPSPKIGAGAIFTYVRFSGLLVMYVERAGELMFPINPRIVENENEPQTGHTGRGGGGT
jgi:hypothetical protein